jgi:ParB-like chromosome segregation protein Spo0J
MIIEFWSLDRVRPYPNNPRINDDAVDAVAASIRELAFAKQSSSTQKE